MNIKSTHAPSRLKQTVLTEDEEKDRTFRFAFVREERERGANAINDALNILYSNRLDRWLQKKHKTHPSTPSLTSKFNRYQDCPKDVSKIATDPNSPYCVLKELSLFVHDPGVQIELDSKIHEIIQQLRSKALFTEDTETLPEPHHIWQTALLNHAMYLSCQLKIAQREARLYEMEVDKDEIEKAQEKTKTDASHHARVRHRRSPSPIRRRSRTKSPSVT